MRLNKNTEREKKIMYSYDTRIRYSETDADLQLSMVGLVKHFQDATIFDSENGKAGMAYLNPKNLVWVLSSWQIEISRMPRLNELVKITTIPYEFRSFMGFRNFLMETEEGEVLAKANSLWTLINTKTGRPEKPDEFLVSAYGLGEKIEMNYKPRKIQVEGEARVLEGFKVLPTQIDSNHHLNNTEYVNMAVACLPEQKKITEMRVEYKTSAHLGDTIVPYVYEQEEEHKTQIQLCGMQEKEGKVDIYAIIEFSFEQKQYN